MVKTGFTVNGSGKDVHLNLKISQFLLYLKVKLKYKVKCVSGKCSLIISFCIGAADNHKTETNVTSDTADEPNCKVPLEHFTKKRHKNL